MLKTKDSALTYIMTEGGFGSWVDKYYFVPVTSDEEALSLAHKYKRPIPECWERWYVVRRIARGKDFTILNKSFTAPDDGFILRFHHESPN